MIKAIIFLEGGQTNTVTYNNKSFEDIFNDYDKMLYSRADFICVGCNNNKTIINKNKIAFIDISEVNNE